MRRHLPVGGVQATDADHGAARSVGIETLEAGADTTWPSLLKTCRSVAKAFSACAVQAGAFSMRVRAGWLAANASVGVVSASVRDSVAPITRLRRSLDVVKSP